MTASEITSLRVQALQPDDFAPYGVVLGVPFGSREPGFSNPATDFWHQHVFDPGHDGTTELLWVNYRKNDSLVSALECHLFTQQAIVPLTGEGIVHVVACSVPESGSAVPEPDLATLKAFFVPRGQGICMHPGCWHASLVRDQQVSCLMLTRSSTTIDLIQGLTSDHSLTESRWITITPIAIHHRS